jgi:virginiamycin B lyase
MNFAQGAPGCTGSGATLTCSITIQAPPGTDTFAINAYDQANATGNQLSTATFQVAIQSGSNTVHAVLNGIIASLSVALGNTAPLMGTAVDIPISVTGSDADSNLIIGPGQYMNPITLANSDATGSTSLSVTTLTVPGAPVTLHYDGLHFANAIITASSVGVTSATSLPLQPVPAAVEYAIPSHTNAGWSMTVGPDNALWFVEANAIGRVTTSGQVTEYPVPAGTDGPGSITTGPDGALWYTTYNTLALIDASVVRVTTTGQFTNYPTTSAYPLNGITTGPDGNLWFCYINNSVGQLTPTGTLKVFSPTYGPELTNIIPVDIVNSLGALWVTDTMGNLDKITTSGQLTVYPAPPVFPGSLVRIQPQRLVVGADGDFYMTAIGSINKMDQNGNILGQVFLQGYPGTFGQIASAGNAVWTGIGTDASGHPALARWATTGAYSQLILEPTGSGSGAVSGLTLGPDGNLWYTRGSNVGKIQINY